MTRQLNPHLFQGESKGETSAPMENSPQKRADNGPISTEEIRLLVHQVESLKRQTKEQEVKLESLQTSFNDLTGATKMRVDRLTGLVQRLEDFMKSHAQDLNEKYAQLAGKLTERQAQDMKVQELIARHQQTLQQFEGRMAQMKKVISEQEFQLMSAKSAVQESQRELSRLKKL